ncbi:MAG: xylulokinase [Anaerolineae bacterium]
MSTTYILAHDLGTTGDKVTLFNAEIGAPVASAFEPYATAYPHPAWAEQDAADWRRAVIQGTQRVLAAAERLNQAEHPERRAAASFHSGQIAVVSFSGMMNGALPVDAAGEPLRSAIIWADQRATAEAALLADRCGAERVYRITGNRATPSCTAAKLLWLQRHQPEVYAATRYFLQAKDYAAFLLSGVIATDYSDASNTNLFDLDARAWASDLAEAAGLDAAKLPPIYPSTTVIGHVTAEAARLTGLVPGTPVVIGGGDGACATVGAGAVVPGDAYAYIGSSAWMGGVAERPLFDPEMRTFNLAHLDPQLYFPLGAMQAAGGALDWFERLLRGEADGRLYDDLAAAAATVPPGANGLLFLPYLMGERSPYWDPGARGAFIGLSMAHGRPELARAVLEGVALNLRLILDALQSQGASIPALRLIGGGARLPLWRQILADVLGLPILLPDLVAEATSLGAAIAGGVGVGLYPDFSVAQRFVRAQEAELPDPDAQKRYAALMPLFEETYRRLESIYVNL